jgi:hypothetical protein
METHATHPASGLPGTIELLKRAFEAYKKKGLSIVGLLVLVFVAVMIVFGVAGLLLGALFAGVGIAGGNGMVLAALGLVAAVVFLALGIIVSSVQSVALVELAIADKPRALGELVKDGLKRWKSAAWVMAVTGFFSLGAFALFGLPGIAVSVFTMFALYTFVDKKALGTAAVLDSHAMVSGRWWPVFGRTLVVMAAAVAASVAFSAFASMVRNQGLLLILSNAFSLGFLSPMSILFAGEMYRELRKRPVHLSEADKQRLLRNYLWTAIAGFVVMALLGSYTVAGMLRVVGSGAGDYGGSGTIRIDPMLDLSL